METDLGYPALANRFSSKEWAERGKTDLIESATARKEAILSKPSRAQFDPALDQAIREKFNIHLPR